MGNTLNDPTAIHAPQSKQLLANLLRSRTCQLSAMDERFWTIIGSGSIGEKAEQLRQKTWAILRAGFAMNPRVVLAMGFFDGFRARNRLPDDLKREREHTEELRKLVRNGQFDKDEWEIIYGIAKRFKGTPIAVRSSAHGDSRGTGIYESYIIPNNKSEQENAAELKEKIRDVVLSSYSESAIAFRKDLNLPDGIAVIIEPVFGNQHTLHEDMQVFGPLYGGIAYSSTSSGQGYAVIAGGMPIGVVQGKGVKVPEGDKTDILGIPSDRFSRRDFDLSGADMQRLEEIGDWIRKGHFVDMKDGYVSDWFEVPHNSIVFNDLSWFFRRLKRLESLLGCPQYVEWAVLDKNKQPSAAILQIADATPKTDFYEFGEAGKTLVKSTYVVGSGQVTCNEFIFIDNPDEVHFLRDYNRTHKGYGVMFGGRLISRMMGYPLLHYGDLNNASVLVEISNMCHAQSPQAHFEGLMDSTGKILMVADEIDYGMLRKAGNLGPDDFLSPLVYPIKLKVTASERQQKAIIELTD